MPNPRASRVRSATGRRCGDAAERAAARNVFAAKQADRAARSPLSLIFAVGGLRCSVSAAISGGSCRRCRPTPWRRSFPCHRQRRSPHQRPPAAQHRRRPRPRPAAAPSVTTTVPLPRQCGATVDDRSLAARTGASSDASSGASGASGASQLVARTHGARLAAEPRRQRLSHRRTQPPAAYQQERPTSGRPSRTPTTPCLPAISTRRSATTNRCLRRDPKNTDALLGLATIAVQPGPERAGAPVLSGGAGSRSDRRDRAGRADQHRRTKRPRACRKPPENGARPANPNRPRCTSRSATSTPARSAGAKHSKPISTPTHSSRTTPTTSSIWRSASTICTRTDWPHSTTGWRWPPPIAMASRARSPSTASRREPPAGTAAAMTGCGHFPPIDANALR